MNIPNYQFAEPSTPQTGPTISIEALLQLRGGELLDRTNASGLVIPVRTQAEVDAVLGRLVPPSEDSFPPKLTPGLTLVPTLHQSGDLFGKVPFVETLGAQAGNLAEGAYLRLSSVPRVLVPQKPGRLWKAVAGQMDELPQGTRESITPNQVNEPGLLFEPYVVNGMYVAKYDTSSGSWHAQITPDGELAEAPWTTERHYKKQGMITGIRAWAFPDGIFSFRPDQHAARYHRDGAHLGYAHTSPEMFLHAIGALLEANREWIPEVSEDRCAYVRFNGFSSTTGIRIKGSHSEIHGLVTPTGPYMPRQLRALLPGMDRPVPPGFGAVKSGLGYPGPARELGRYASAAKPYHEAIFGGEKGLQEGLSAGIAAVFYGQGEGGKDLVVFVDRDEVLPSIMHRSAEAWLAHHGERFEVRRDLLSSDRLLQADEVMALGTAALAAEITELRGPGRFDAGGRLEQEGEVLFSRDRAPGELGRVTGFVREGLLRAIKRDPSLPSPFNTWMQRVA